MLSAMAGVTWWNFYFRLFPGAIRSPQIIEFLSHLLRHIPGKLLIVWDGLPGHRSRATWEFIREQRGRLWVEFLPGYAPELNPVEYLWSHWKQRELPNFHPTSFGPLSHYALARPCAGCAAGLLWFAPSGNRRSCFFCNYIMQHSMSLQKGSPGSSSVFSCRTAFNCLGSIPRACKSVGATCEVATGVLSSRAGKAGFETIRPTLVSPKLNPPCSAFFLVDPV